MQCVIHAVDCECSRLCCRVELGLRRPMKYMNANIVGFLNKLSVKILCIINIYNIKTEIKNKFNLDNNIMQYYKNCIYTTTRNNIRNVPTCVSTLCNSWTYLKNCDKLDEIRKWIDSRVYTYVYFHLWMRRIDKRGSGIFSF